MQKGQVSLEIIIVILGVVSALGTISVLAENSVESQETILLQNQAKGIASEVANNLNGLAILSSTASGTQITIPTRGPIISDPSQFNNCTITMNSGKAIVTINRVSAGTITAEKDVFVSGWNISLPNSCGGNITATKT